MVRPSGTRVGALYATLARAEKRAHELTLAHKIRHGVAVVYDRALTRKMLDDGGGVLMFFGMEFPPSRV